jgi:hypothetical protein
MRKYAAATALAITLMTMLDAETVRGVLAISSAQWGCGAPPSCGTAPALYKARLCEMPA